MSGGGGAGAGAGFGTGAGAATGAAGAPEAPLYAAPSAGVTERARLPRGRHGALFAARCLAGRCIAGRFQVVHGVHVWFVCLATGCLAHLRGDTDRLSHAAC